MGEGFDRSFAILAFPELPIHSLITAATADHQRVLALPHQHHAGRFHTMNRKPTLWQDFSLSAQKHTPQVEASTGFRPIFLHYAALRFVQTGTLAKPVDPSTCLRVFGRCRKRKNVVSSSAKKLVKGPFPQTRPRSPAPLILQDAQSFSRAISLLGTC